MRPSASVLRHRIAAHEAGMQAQQQGLGRPDLARQRGLEQAERQGQQLHPASVIAGIGQADRQQPRQQRQAVVFRQLLQLHELALALLPEGSSGQANPPGAERPGRQGRGRRCLVQGPAGRLRRLDHQQARAAPERVMRSQAVLAERGGKHHACRDLELGRPQSIGRFAEAAGHGREHVLAQRGDERDDHYAHHDAGAERVVGLDAEAERLLAAERTDEVVVSVREAAEGMGLSAWQRLYKVELPLAAPVILAGIRISVTIGIGTATIGSTVGALTLGTPIFDGLVTNKLPFVLEGAVLVALFAILADLLFARLEGRFR